MRNKNRSLLIKMIEERIVMDTNTLKRLKENNAPHSVITSYDATIKSYTEIRDYINNSAT